MDRRDSQQARLQETRNWVHTSLSELLADPRMEDIEWVTTLILALETASMNGLVSNESIKREIHSWSEQITQRKSFNPSESAEYIRHLITIAENLLNTI